MYSPKTGNVSQVQPQCIFDTYHKYILDMYPIRCRLTKRLRIPYVQWIRSWNVFVIHIVNAECSGNVFLIRCGYISRITYTIHFENTLQLCIPYMQWIRSWNVFVIHIVNVDCSGNVFLIRCGYISWNTFPLHIENILQLRILYMQWICSCNAFAIHILTFVV